MIKLVIKFFGRKTKQVYSKYKKTLIDYVYTTEFISKLKFQRRRIHSFTFFAIGFQLQKITNRK